LLLPAVALHDRCLPLQSASAAGQFLASCARPHVFRHRPHGTTSIPDVRQSRRTLIESS
jgi:hypothetical protein